MKLPTSSVCWTVALLQPMRVYHAAMLAGMEGKAMGPPPFQGTVASAVPCTWRTEKGRLCLPVAAA